MITANELRIGNWIADRGLKEWQIHHWEGRDKVASKPRTTMCMGVLSEMHPLTEYVDYLKPIKLTEDWLERFGFEILVGWRDVWYKDGFDRFELTEIHDEYFFNDTHIEFVHQLQNAFFCIEQAELTPSDGGKIE